MTNKERELIMKNMSLEQRELYRKFITDVGPRLKLSNGRRMLLKELIESGEGSAPAEIRPAIEAVCTRDAMGPQVGAPAIDFRLKRLDENEYIRLLDFKNRRPVALIFGSYTWPPFRAQSGRLQKVYEEFREQVEFFIVYIQEAHPTDGRQSDKNIDDGILYRQHRSFAERAEIAQSCALALDLSIPVLVEDMSDSTDNAYGAAPERLFLIARDGSVAYRGGVGPHFFDIDEWQAAIRSNLGRQAA